MYNRIAFRFTFSHRLSPVVTSDPPKPYTEAETAYVRHCIATGEFADTETREAVNDLLRLEEFVENPPDGFGGGLLFGRLRNEHPIAYDAIQAELDPESFRCRREREQEQRGEELAYELAVRKQKQQAEREAAHKRHEREWASVERDREELNQAE